MEMQKFEETLEQMTKPEISQLRHQGMLANAITNAKDKSVFSWWWLSVPLYILAALWMKSIFKPHTTLLSNFHDLASHETYLSVLFFLVVPVVFIIINCFSIRKIYFLSGNPKTFEFLQAVWSNIMIIVFSVLILLFYSL
jgi:hypothetical protein